MQEAFEKNSGKAQRQEKETKLEEFKTQLGSVRSMKSFERIRDKYEGSGVLLPSKDYIPLLRRAEQLSWAATTSQAQNK